ncbi:polymorphic toxin type 44 domain-containing protein, partial [Desulfovibrio sp. JC022]|uniref:polymorphic toxin type 44 domain-containing protein n=1 Tax=Desulfovibrio sp. JC022 TaxID=2593642 RepID=UPI0013D74389
INTLSGKPEAQKARKEEPLAETMAKAQMAKEKETLERRARGDMERRNHRAGLLEKTANAKQQSKAKKGMLTTKEYDDITDSVFNVDPNDQIRKGKKQEKEKISSVQHARNMERIANDPARNTKLSSTQHAARLSSIEKQRRQDQIDKILNDTDENFHKYEGIPVAPDGVSVDKNIKDAEEFKKSIQELSSYDQTRKTEEYIMSRFPNKHPMDYKQRGREYERFGNFNYGAVMNALGVPELVGRGFAGYAQYKAGTAKGKWALNFGDDPKDQWDIKQGYRYYENKHVK